MEHGVLMSLDKVQDQLVEDWLQQKQVVRQCPVCQADDWVILEMVEAPVRWPHELHSGGPRFPMIPRGCRNCGYLMFFSAAKLGLGASADDNEPDHTRT